MFRPVFLFLLLPLSATAGVIDHAHLFATGGKSMTNWHGQADIQSLYFEVGHDWSPRTEFILETGGHSVWQPRSWFGDLYNEGHEKALAVSSSIGIRRYFRMTHTPQIYTDLSSGPMWATKRVPAATSHFNFISQGGVGFLFPRDHASLLVGYRFAHVSNGGYAPLNSGLNIHMLTVGTRWGRR
jgi:hypothetical protein